MSWNVQLDADSFTVVYTKTTGTQQLGPCKDDTDTGTVTATGSSTTLSNLRAFTTYTVHVIAVSGFGGMSSQSSPRTFTTSQTGELYSTVPADKRIHNNSYPTIRESVDSLCRDDADMPMPPYIRKAYNRHNAAFVSLFR